MKTPAGLLVALCLAASAYAQAPVAGAEGTGYTPEQLDQLLAPIALYPDPLIALILPASTVPKDLSAAAQYVAGGGDPSGIDAQSWDPSVKGLAHYPDVLKWMNDNLDWTRTLGAAFAMQPSDVMQSIQQLRAKAKAAGTLTDTPQQQVDMEGDDIRIVPTEPNTIFVPEYDPDLVYGDAPPDYVGPFISFGIGFPVGPWLGFECDWDDFGIWTHRWAPGWEYRRDWRDRGFDGRRWHPDPNRGHSLVRNYYRPGSGFAPPPARPMPGVRVPPERAPVGGPAPRAPAPVVRTPAPAVRAPPAPSRPNYRGYAPVATPSTPAPRGEFYGGYSRGTDARTYSSRGQASRSVPVSRPAPAPARASAPSSGGRERQR